FRTVATDTIKRACDRPSRAVSSARGERSDLDGRSQETSRMRRSLAALALIHRTTDPGETVWLLRWNQRWQAFSFVGGHREDGETCRACCVREVAEELGLHDGGDCHVAMQPLKHLEFTAWSQAAQEDTAYTFELFEVELRTPAARQQVAASPHNRWVT